MARTRPFRMVGMRRAGIILGGVLVAGMAVGDTALASSVSPSASMAGMASGTSSGGHVGFTKGWYAGRTVRFYYTKNFYCRTPPASTASTKCVAGPNYIRTPSGSFDPLYVVVPLGFTPPKSTLQCPVAGHCIDHPSTIDLTAVLGSGTGNILLPAHSHIVATNNGGQAEWWNVDVVGVKSLWAWNQLVRYKSDAEMMYLQRHDSSVVTGNITTNLFLYFSVLR